MKWLATILFLSFTISTSTAKEVVTQGQIEVSGSGQNVAVRIVYPPEKWQKTGVKVTPRADKYTKAVKEVFKAGKPITVKWRKIFKKPSFFYLDTIQKGVEAVQYNKKQQLIEIAPSTELKKNRSVDSAIFFMIIAASFMSTPLFHFLLLSSGVKKASNLLEFTSIAAPVLGYIESPVVIFFAMVFLFDRGAWGSIILLLIAFLLSIYRLLKVRTREISQREIYAETFLLLLNEAPLGLAMATL